MKKITKEQGKVILRLLLLLLLIAVVLLAIYLPLKLTGTIDKIDTAEELKEFILSFGGYGYVMLFLIQFLQTTFMPTPTFLTTIAASLIYGPWITFAITYPAVLLGSVTFYFIGKKLGRGSLRWALGQKLEERCERMFSKGHLSYPVIALFPFFPQDTLCFAAGTVNMNFWFFIATNILARPISIILSCFLGTGHIIPYSGWGIPVWIALVAVGIILFVLSFIYSEKIEAFLLKVANKIFHKKSDDHQDENHEDIKLKDEEEREKPLQNNEKIDKENKITENVNTKDDEIT